MSDPRVSACVINHDGEACLPTTLEALRRSSRAFHEILLVDVASTDRSVELVRRDHPEVRVVRLARNVGPGLARNAGFRRATGDLVLFVDNDVAPEPDCARLLVRALAEAPDVTFAMPRVVFADRPDTVQYEGADAHFLGLLSLRNGGVPVDVAGSPASLRPGSLVSACFVVDRRRWGRTRLFDETIFMYLEDHELGLRARILGHHILTVPEAVCRHGAGTPGLSLRRVGHHTPMRIVGHIGNRWKILLKLYEIRTLALLAPLLATFEAFQLAGAIARGWSGEWLRAARGVLGSLPRTLAARREVQRGRVRGDGSVLSGGPLPFTSELLASDLQRAAFRSLDAVARGYWAAVSPLLRR